MLRPFLFLAGIALSLTVTAMPAIAGADWPSRVFAPYMYLGADDNFQLTRCNGASGQKYYTLAFLIADKQNNPAWDGRFSPEANYYADQIAAIRAQGGDVIASFGGEAGKELALVDPDLSSLQAKYESVIARYKLSWLDFDIEGDALANTAANKLRNAVLARLQAAHPGLIISYTLPVDLKGIPDDGLRLLSDAQTQGVHVYSANVMTMDFDPTFCRGKKISDICMTSAIKARDQCRAINPAIKIGLTPCIGQSDEKGEDFTESDAKALEAWAVTQPWVCSLSFWSINRDAGLPGLQNDDSHSGIPQKPWAFTRLFQPFTTR